MKFSVSEKRLLWIMMGVASILIFFIVLRCFVQPTHPTIDTAHVINLDRDTKKLETFMKQPYIPDTLEVVRWRATYGKDLNVNEMCSAGIGGAMFVSGKGAYTDYLKDLRNLGAIGCFLSHRSLLQHLASTDVPDSAGHLILEDDAQFSSDFLNGQHTWNKIRTTIPTDWDMVFIGIVYPKGKHIEPGVMKLESNFIVKDGDGNYGTHAYLVRHGAIRTKILPWLRHMVDTIDRQYNYKFDEWNVYAVDPTRININETLGSSIQAM